MATENRKIAFLKNQIAARLQKTDSSRVYYRKKSFYHYMGSAVLTGIATIALGLNLRNAQYNERIRILALSITTLVTILNVYNAFYNHRELWVAYNQATNRFRQLLFEIEFAESGDTDIPEEKTEWFRKQYQDIIDERNATWQKNRLVKSASS